jgi:alpha-N-arabinofuranosidase
LFAINRSLNEAMPLEVTLSGFGPLTLAEAQVLRHDDLGAVNTADEPNKVAPASLDRVTVVGDRAEMSLPPASWSMIRLGKTA